MPIIKLTEMCKNEHLLKVNCTIFRRPGQSQTKCIQTLDSTVRIRTTWIEISFHFQREIHSEFLTHKILWRTYKFTNPKTILGPCVFVL